MLAGRAAMLLFYDIVPESREDHDGAKGAMTPKRYGFRLISLHNMYIVSTIYL